MEKSPQADSSQLTRLDNMLISQGVIGHFDNAMQSSTPKIDYANEEGDQVYWQKLAQVRQTFHMEMEQYQYVCNQFYLPNELFYYRRHNKSL